MSPTPSRNAEMQARAREGRERKRSRRRRGHDQEDFRRFIMDGEGALHRPRTRLSHVATELLEDGRRDLAENLVKPLRPWAQRALIGCEALPDA